jgi:D-3-phosphoglycerate dehydrogenase
MYKVLNTVDFSGCDGAFDNLRSIAIVDSVKPDKNSVSEIIHKYDVYISTLEFRLDRALIDKAVNLKVVATPSTGTDHLDLKYLSEKGILCFDLSKEYDLINSFSATSELAFILLQVVNRKIYPAIISAKSGFWGRETFCGNQLLGKTMGIIGVGRLGKISSRIANGYGMKVIGNDIENKDVPGVEMVAIEELCERSDFISIHVHLNESTRNLICKKLISLMKPSCILINTSRGALINENDLLEALKNKIIAGAGLDMIDGEWLDNKLSHPLVEYSLNNDNLVITPHIGGVTYESIYGARIFIAEKVFKYLNEK